MSLRQGVIVGAQRWPRKAGIEVDQGGTLIVGSPLAGVGINERWGTYRRRGFRDTRHGTSVDAVIMFVRPIGLLPVCFRVSGRRTAKRRRSCLQSKICVEAPERSSRLLREVGSWPLSSGPSTWIRRCQGANHRPRLLRSGGERGAHTRIVSRGAENVQAVKEMECPSFQRVEGHRGADWATYSL
jgi:hypothetical protein